MATLEGPAGSRIEPRDGEILIQSGKFHVGSDVRSMLALDFGENQFLLTGGRKGRLVLWQLLVENNKLKIKEKKSISISPNFTSSNELVKDWSSCAFETLLRVPDNWHCFDPATREEGFVEILVIGTKYRPAGTTIYSLQVNALGKCKLSKSRSRREHFMGVRV
jgi:hypothetical protein